ncbi:MAG: serine/threonine-protein kinase, partial [Planctomycetota bacterium]|nr:serine/threonine-protein kinase [Planctomycetota bacterium]
MSCPECKALVADDIATVALSPSPVPNVSSKPSYKSHSATSPTLSNWEFLEEIGRGGMGVVQRVRDKKLGRQAALKILRANNASQQVEDRFLRESKVTANLDHPSIPAVFDAGRDESGHPYLLMRLVRGETLGHHIKVLHQNDSNNPRRYLEALLKVSEAVAHAHDRGIIHRNLKPENIMIGNYGDVLVMDWGLAGFKDDNPNDEETVVGERPQPNIESTVSADPHSGDTDLTLPGTVMGTPGYMSPEQADGAWVDERSDIFALGAILTEILTGQSPISGDSALSKIKRTLEGDFLYPSDSSVDSALELDWIARQALALDPDQRTTSAIIFIAQLRSYLAGSPVPGYPYSRQERLEGWLRRHPFVVVVSSAMAFILLITVLYGLSWQA